ncbi:helix-turn-helix domain-containing protein [Paenibacillus sp. EKM205P]|uniref:helix-turn-helix domain-containing protein n=1 Tax=Paenibacillus sp. EKM205P TaxID=1683673 RepID=UPI001EEC4B1E|nr:helix-turn-helix domain-containing protein [Paenibacillus sp. EKM205P]
MSVGKRIQDLRMKRGYTQEYMSEKLDMNRANFSNYERNKAVPPGDKLAEIANILRTSTDYLLGRIDDPSGTLTHPEWATYKDKRDFKKMLEEDEPVLFDGIPIDEDDKEKLKKVIEAMFWDAKKQNKRKPVDE